MNRYWSLLYYRNDPPELPEAFVNMPMFVKISNRSVQSYGTDSGIRTTFKLLKEIPPTPKFSPKVFYTFFKNLPDEDRTYLALAGIEIKEITHPLWINCLNELETKRESYFEHPLLGG